MPKYQTADQKSHHPLQQELAFQLLEPGLISIGLTITPQQKHAVAEHFALITETNQVTNLTTVTDWETALTRHFLDSLSLLLALNGITTLPASPRLLDIGTGAGFPGIPIKIFCPNFQVDLVESRKKKGAFLEKVIKSLKLHDTRVYAERAESLAHGSLRESYDVVVSRAVAPLNTLVELCLPFVRIGGVFIAMKQLNVGEEIQESLTAVEKLGGAISMPPLEVDLPNLLPKRALVLVKKISPSPNELPRAAGIPQKRPIK